MPLRSTLITFAVFFVICQSTPIKKRPDVGVSLDNYVNWMNLVSDQFEGEVTSSIMADLEQQGQDAHDQLMDAIRGKETQLDETMNTENVNTNVLATLEEEITAANIGVDKMVGLVLADSVTSSHGAKLAISSEVFQQMTSRLQTHSQNGISTIQDLEALFEDVSAAEIAFDSMIMSFKQTEQLAAHTRQKRSTFNLPGSPPIGGSRLPNMFSGSENSRFGQNGLNLGGGFSTDGQSLTYNRGRTTVTATPHYSLKPKPQFHGATGSFEHRFQNNRGSVFGSATVDNRGRFQSGGVGIRIEF